jgi:ParB family transcriptional regulator, chromosome partitioning protein
MANKKSGLGKGFDALIPTDFDASLLVDAEDRVKNLFISEVQPNPEQPRRHFDKDALAELAVSIKQYGVLQPIIVSPAGEGYIIVAGERRWRASSLAGLKRIPAIVRNRKELEQLEVALIENVQRVDLSPLEQAVSIERLHQQFNISYAEIAKRLGKAETTISNIVRLLQLPPIARDALQAGLITEGHARAILSLKGDVEKQTELLALIQKHGWSVRQAEQFVSAYKQGIDSKRTVSTRLSSETPQTKLLSKHLGHKVSLKRTAKGGRLEIHFRSDDDLEKIVKRLSK